MHKRYWLAVSLSLAAFWVVSEAFDRPERIAAAAALPPLEEAYPTDYFMPPVAGPIRATGTFGELRPDHFHSGLDIDGHLGDPVYAAADGFVDRIKVQASGYGNVLYIKHPNGYTTLYAHLDRFSPEIAQFVKENQYKRERFEIELQPPDGTFKVKKGQEIAKLGNTGGSTGPHLHFEVRNTATSKAINPLLCGIPLADKIAPDIRDMKIYFLNERREVLGAKPFPLYKDKRGNIGLQGDTVRIGGWRVGFGVKVYDRAGTARNDNGIYTLALYADDQLAFQWRMNELDFDETRYLNAHTDYSARKRYGAWFHRCFVLPGDRLSNYAATESLGSILLYKEKPVKITIKASDVAGNTSIVQFWALRDEAAMETFVSAPFQFYLPFDAENRVDLDGFSMQLPKSALYESLQFQYETTLDESAGVYSPVHHLQDERTPVHRYFDLSIRPTHLPADLRSKAVIAQCGAGKPDNCGGTWQGDVLTTRVRNFGDYCVMADTQPPSIVPVVFDGDMRRKHTMSFRIQDNFAVGGTADGLSYRGTVDGQWVLFEYDRKRARLTHTFDGRISTGEHLLRLAVRDDRGNEAVFEQKFLR
jgi:murein DD-endopeptidase MepM/ murein hydrolase activator NlpD